MGGELELKIAGRIFEISGSISENTDMTLIRYAHSFIWNLVSRLAKSGARFIINPGKEPFVNHDSEKLPLIFDWTVISAINQSILAKEGVVSLNSVDRPIIAIVKQGYMQKIPKDKIDIWNNLLSNGLIQLKFIDRGWSSGAYRRVLMSQIGDILLCLGGGEGVEHSAREYLIQTKTVLPLDLQLGSNFNDGSGGASRLFEKMLSAPEHFFKVENASEYGYLASSIATEDGTASLATVVSNFINLIEKLLPPSAFFVRLLNKDHEDFAQVESYFRNVIDSIINEIGYSYTESGRVKPTDAWMNVDIFNNLHNSAIVFADLTGLRPNCFIEFGYSLGRNRKTILTARKGTPLPFDSEMYECFFWDPEKSWNITREELKKFLERNMGRPPLVKIEGVL